MNDFLIIFVGTLLSYLLGSSNMAVYLAKIKGVDVLNAGTKNPGTSNTLILMGKKAAVLVGIHDIGKGFLAVFLCKYFYESLELLIILSAVAVILGHMFPFWMKFKGGKGFATYIGVSLALNFEIGLAVLIVALLFALILDYIVIGTMIVVIGNPVVYFCMGNLLYGFLLMIPTIIIVLKPRETLKNIANGTEKGIRKAIKGKYKEK